MEFSGNLCIVSIWRDVSMLEIKADPRRRFCEKLAWGVDKVKISGEEQSWVCTLWDRASSNCFGNYDIKWKEIGFVPTMCPQFPCRDFKNTQSRPFDDSAQPNCAHCDAE